MGPFWFEPLPVPLPVSVPVPLPVPELLLLLSSIAHGLKNAGVLAVPRMVD